jgi:hypothetical protein
MNGGLSTKDRAIAFMLLHLEQRAKLKPLSGTQLQPAP